MTLTLVNAFLSVLFVIVLVLLADYAWYKQDSFIAKEYRYRLYWYWVHVKKYEWQVLHDFGGGYKTPLLRRSQAIKYVSKSGDRITGVDDQLRVIFCRERK